MTSSLERSDEYEYGYSKGYADAGKEAMAKAMAHFAKTLQAAAKPAAKPAPIIADTSCEKCSALLKKIVEDMNKPKSEDESDLEDAQIFYGKTGNNQSE